MRGHASPGLRGGPAAVVATTGAERDTRLADAIAATGRRVHAIGDCHAIGSIEGATRSALEVARAIGALAPSL